MASFQRNITTTFKRVYRLLKVKHASAIVWNDLIKMHKQAGWYFTIDEQDNIIVASLPDKDNGVLKVHFRIEGEKLLFIAFIVPEFDIERTNDIMVLSSHFNSLLKAGVVSVNLHHNFVKYTFFGDILRYLLYPDEIFEDLKLHFSITEECLQAFTSMLNTGDDPVFVVAEFMKRVEQEEQC